MLNLGVCYYSAGHLDKAEPTLRECLALRQRRVPQDWWTYYTQTCLGEVLAQLKRFEESEAVLLEGQRGMQARVQKIVPNERLKVVQVLGWIVKLYEAWEKPDQAAKWRAKLEETKAEAK